MFAHADETDDFEPVTKAHPGCAVVPAALAMAERGRRSGTEFLRAVTLGYDLCCRFLMALGPDHVRATHRSAEGTSATFGAAAAAASLARLDERGMRFALSYARAAGVGPLELDARRGPRREGVRLRRHGRAQRRDGGHDGRRPASPAWPTCWTASTTCSIALSSQPRPEEMVAGLGTRFFVSETRHQGVFGRLSDPVAARRAADAAARARPRPPRTSTRLVVRLPEDGARIVDGNAMPDVNLQHLMAVALIDGTVSFEMSHSRERMKDPQVLAVKARVQLVGDRALVDPDAPRSGAVEATLSDGRVVRHFTRHPPGTKENPLDAAAVAAKARGADGARSSVRAARTPSSRA